MKNMLSLHIWRDLWARSVKSHWPLSNTCKYWTARIRFCQYQNYKFLQIARNFSIHTFSILAINSSNPGVLDSLDSFQLLYNTVQHGLLTWIWKLKYVRNWYSTLHHVPSLRLPCTVTSSSDESIEPATFRLLPSSARHLKFEIAALQTGGPSAIWQCLSAMVVERLLKLTHLIQPCLLVHLAMAPLSQLLPMQWVWKSEAVQASHSIGRKVC